MKNVSVGQKVMVFDSRLWQQNGGDSETDTFFREAKVLKTYAICRTVNPPKYEHLADVQFDHDGRISKGHFVNVMQVCPYLTGGRR